MNVEEQVAQLANENAEWREFTRSPQWREYSKILRAQIATRRLEVDSLMLDPSQDAVIKRLAKDHEIAGIKIALAMPSLLIQDNEMTISMLQDEDNYQDAEE